MTSGDHSYTRTCIIIYSNDVYIFFGGGESPGRIVSFLPPPASSTSHTIELSPLDKVSSGRSREGLDRAPASPPFKIN